MSTSGPVSESPFVSQNLLARFVSHSFALEWTLTAYLHAQNFNDGGQPSSDDIWSFTTQAIQYLESNPVVQTYAPFGFMDDMYNVNPADCLFAPDNLSALGWLYVNGA
jgi:hypothetical protein